MFAQQWSHLVTHFSERIHILKQWMSVHKVQFLHWCFLYHNPVPPALKVGTNCISFSFFSTRQIFQFFFFFFNCDDPGRHYLVVLLPKARGNTRLLLWFLFVWFCFPSWNMSHILNLRLLNICRLLSMHIIRHAMKCIISVLQSENRTNHWLPLLVRIVLPLQLC